MTRTMMAALAACSVIALGGCNKQASSGGVTAGDGAPAISGTWKADVSTIHADSKPDVFLLKDGTYTCSTCTPPLTLAADGAFHPVTGRPYADAVSIKVDNDHSVTRVSQKGGRETGRGTMTVSPDGKTLTLEWRDSSTPNAAPTSGKVTETRVAAGPVGSHAISGSWSAPTVNQLSANATTVTYHLDGDTLTMNGGGQSYSAKLGGPEAPVQGDIGGTTVTVEKAGDTGIRETFHRGGKVVSVWTSTVGADGKLSVAEENKEDGSSFRYQAVKS